MKFRLILSCIAGLLGLLAVSAQADTQLAHVTNNVVDSGSCSLVGVNGGQGWASFKITCGAEVAYVTHNISGGICNTSVSSGYYVSGGCTSVSQNSYTLYKSGPVAPQPTPTWVKLTDVTNTMTSSNPACTVQSAGGTGYSYYTYVGYRVVCGSTVVAVTLTYNNMFNSCSLSNAPAGFSFSGSCNSYSVYQQQ
jgi:hypothetical protein